MEGSGEIPSPVAPGVRRDDFLRFILINGFNTNEFKGCFRDRHGGTGMLGFAQYESGCLSFYLLILLVLIGTHVYALTTKCVLELLLLK